MKKTLLIILAGVLMLGLFGCGKPKYNVNIDEYGFNAKKVTYKESEKVQVTYDLIATDTDYSFYLDCDDTELDVDYENGAYVLTFKMPAHDVTVCVDAQNTMAMLDNNPIVISAYNQVATGDLWIMEDTPENRKTSTWGGAIVEDFGVDEFQPLIFENASADDKYIVRMIDEDKNFYEVSGVEILDGQKVVIREGEYPMTAFVSVYDLEGNLMNEYEMFVGRL